MAGWIAGRVNQGGNRVWGRGKERRKRIELFNRRIFFRFLLLLLFEAADAAS